MTFKFRGHNVEATCFRVRHADRLPDKHYYEIREDDDGRGDPITVEVRVIVNHFGTIISDDAIDLGPDGFLVLTEDEQSDIFNNVG
jgi:hypothetical protein